MTVVAMGTLAYSRSHMHRLPITALLPLAAALRLLLLLRPARS
jgi:hypothetical protein